MEAIAFVLGFVVLGALALRFGQDSRDGFRSAEHTLTGYGMTWADLPADRGVPTAAGPATAAHEAPATVPASGSPAYPTLVFIERALALAAGRLTGLPDAARLEAQARTLTAEYWSDAVWTTGVVSPAAYLRVLAELAPGLHDAPVWRVERPATVAEPVALPRPAIVPDRQPAARERMARFGVAGSTATA